MTNTEKARAALVEIVHKWDTGALPDENAAANLEIVLDHVRVLVGYDGPEEPCPVRHTSCRCCGLDVEVWLDAPELLGRDRGGNANCASGLRHVPVLDADDLDVREQLIG